MPEFLVCKALILHSPPVLYESLPCTLDGNSVRIACFYYFYFRFAFLRSFLFFSVLFFDFSFIR